MKTNPTMAAVWICVAGLGLTPSGCNRDVRLADAKLRDVTVKPVTHYGVTLDAQASPEQVAFVALQAVRDDFLAESAEAREAALDVQFAISAATVLDMAKGSTRTRREQLHYIVMHWTPTVSHYVGDFPKTLEEAQSRFRRSAARTRKSGNTEVEQCEVLMEAADPSGDPRAQVVMMVHLARDSGLWRVLYFGFDRNRRSLSD